MHACIIKVRKIYFLEKENNAEVPNVEEIGHNPLIILTNVYMLYCLDYYQTTFWLYNAS